MLLKHIVEVHFSLQVHFVFFVLHIQLFAVAYLADIEVKTGLPATDPYRYGAGKLVDALAALS